MPSKKKSALTKSMGVPILRLRPAGTLGSECIIANAQHENVSFYQINGSSNLGAGDSKLATECIIANAWQENIGSFRIQGFPILGAEEGTLASECIIANDCKE